MVTAVNGTPAVRAHSYAAHTAGQQEILASVERVVRIVVAARARTAAYAGSTGAGGVLAPSP
jgi:hypothetical protein